MITIIANPSILTDPTVPSGATLTVMYDTGFSFLATKKNNLSPVQVESQVPYWMRINSDGYGNHSLMINFLSSYYEWLSNEYGYENTSMFDMTRLSDINEAPEYLLPHFIKFYAPDIQKLYDLPPNQKPTDKQIRATIENIRTELYQRKSTEVCFKSFLFSLFGIDPSTVNIIYPKTKLMRSGSYLNQGVLQDGKMWQEYSYIIQSEVDDSNPYYETVLKETIHPAGLLGFFEKEEIYEEDSDEEEDYIEYEIPMVANYYPYTLGSFESLPFCTGCSSGYPLFETGWTFPTFEYPDWSLYINQAPFGNIIISTFMTELGSTSDSPNDNIGTRCDLICGSTGSVFFTWGLTLDGLFREGITGVSAGEPIDFINQSTFGFNRFLWQFGDGSTSSSENPRKRYTTNGIYGVTLTGFKDSASYSDAIRGATFYIA